MLQLAVVMGILGSKKWVKKKLRNPIKMRENSVFVQKREVSSRLASSYVNAAVARELLPAVFCQNEHFCVPLGGNVLLFRDQELIVFLICFISLGSSG